VELELVEIGKPMKSCGHNIWEYNVWKRKLLLKLQYLFLLSWRCTLYLYTLMKDPTVLCWWGTQWLNWNQSCGKKH